ncbi:6037_t:CDS:10 [Entrophospora sp. SA101]|nr:6037_t:CDS:10 [Entrophospora sp. SA101]
MNNYNVYQLFNATYNPDPNIQKQAELQLKQIEGTPGFITNLLQILSAQELDNGTKQAVSIYLKNRIRTSWYIDEEEQIPSNVVAIDLQDREAFKANILNILVTVPSIIRVQVLDSLRRVLGVDFPEKWPNYMDQVITLLTSNDLKISYIGLLGLQQVVKVYQWRSPDVKDPLIEIIQKSFPILLQIAEIIINETNVDAGEMMKIIVKTFGSSIHYELPKPLQDSTFIGHWLGLLLKLVDKQIPQELIPQYDDVEERRNFIWYRVQKWSCHVLDRLFSRYGNPAQLSSSPTKNMTFAETFVQNFAPQILYKYLEKTNLWMKKEIWLSPKVLYYISSFYKESITHKITWKILKPHCEILVSHYIFPQLCFTDEDEQLWSEDPIDFIHKKLDPLDDYLSPTSSAISFLGSLARHRKKFTFTNILNFINSILTTYQESPPETKNPKNKDGALKMIGCLSDLALHRKSGVANIMEAFFIHHVFPEFQSQHPYLRARACDMIMKFNELEFQQEANIMTAFQGITICMQDPELPVKIQACLALEPLLKYESVKKVLVPNLPAIMQSNFKLLELTNMIDSDILATLMKELVEEFSSELNPFATEFCQQLCATFLRIMHDYKEIPSTNDNIDDSSLDDAEMNEKILTASGIIRTVVTLIVNLDTTPEVLIQMESSIMPIVIFVLENEVIELYEEVLDIIDSLTFSIKQISPAMWNIFELLYRTFKKSGVDYIECKSMLPSLDNYISYGTEVFMQNSNFHVMKSENLSETDRVAACKLAESFLLNCSGIIDQYIEPILGLVFKYLADIENIETSSFKFYCVELVIDCLYYNPLLTLRILEERSLTQSFFTLWFKDLSHFSRVHDKKLVIATICRFFEIPIEQLPATLQNGWSQLLDGVLEMFKSFPEAEENDENIEDEDKEYLDFLSSEACKKLTKLNCSRNFQLTNLDLSQNLELEELICIHNGFTSLAFLKLLTKLEHLDIRGNNTTNCFTKCKTTQQSNIGTDLSTSLFFKRKIKTRGLFKGVSIYTTGILGDILAHFSTYDASREHVNKGNAKGIGLSCLEDRSQTTINAFLGTSSDVINSSLWYQLMLYHDNFKFLRHLRHRRLVIPGGELSSLNYNNNNNTCIDIIYQNSIN